MSNDFLSALARHISLHPSCRAELRHHWPAPHYHRTPLDEAADDEAQLRRHAAGVAPSTSADAVGLTAGSLHEAQAAALTRAAFVEFNPYETFRLRRTRRRKGERAAAAAASDADAAADGVPRRVRKIASAIPTALRRQRNASFSPSSKSTSSAAAAGARSRTPPPTRGRAVAATTSSSTLVKARSGDVPPSPSAGAAIAAAAAATTPSVAKKSKSAAAAVGGVAKASAAAATPSRASTAGPSSASRSTTTTTAASSQPRPGGATAAAAAAAPCGGAPKLKRAASTAEFTTAGGSSKAKKASDAAAAPTSAAAGDAPSFGSATPKRNRGKTKVAAHCDPTTSDTAAATAKVKAPTPATLTAAVSGSATGAASPRSAGAGSEDEDACEATEDSDNSGRVCDPFHMRLPRTTPHPRAGPTGAASSPTAAAGEAKSGGGGGGGGHRPVHVTVRWSGSRQRRRRFYERFPSCDPASAAAAVLWRGAAAMVAEHELRRGGSAEMSPHGVGAVRDGDAAEDAAMMAPRVSVDDFAETRGQRKSQQPQHTPPQQPGRGMWSSDREEAGHTPGTTTTTTTTATKTTSSAEGRRTSVTTGGRAIAYSHARMHGHGDDDEFASSNGSALVVAPYSAAVSSAGASHALARSSSQAHLAQQLQSRSAAVCSHSTATATRTSALGISGSELPTPSSVDHFPAAATSTTTTAAHGFVRRPNSLLIIRYPPLDVGGDAAAAAAACGVYQSTRAGGGSPGGSAVTGLHGLRGGTGNSGSPNNLRVTYVTANTSSSAHPPHFGQHPSTERGSSSLASAQSSRLASPQLGTPQQHQGQQAGANPHASSAFLLHREAHRPQAIITASTQHLSDTATSASGAQPWSAPESPVQPPTNTASSGEAAEGRLSTPARRPVAQDSGSGAAVLTKPLPYPAIGAHAYGAGLVAAASSVGSASAAAALMLLIQKAKPGTRASAAASSAATARAAAAAGTPVAGSGGGGDGGGGSGRGGGPQQTSPQQTSPQQQGLSVKTVLMQRRQSSLQRRQPDEQRERPQQLLTSPTSSAGAGTVAFSPLIVHVSPRPSDDDVTRQGRGARPGLRAPMPLDAQSSDLCPLAMPLEDFDGPVDYPALYAPRQASRVSSSVGSGVPTSFSEFSPATGVYHSGAGGTGGLSSRHPNGSYTEVPSSVLMSHDPQTATAAGYYARQQSLSGGEPGAGLGGGGGAPQHSLASSSPQFYHQLPNSASLLLSYPTAFLSSGDEEVRPEGDRPHLPSLLHPLAEAPGDAVAADPRDPWMYPSQYYAASESTAWLENNGFTTFPCTPAVTPMWRHGMPFAGITPRGGPAAVMVSEPATPLCLPPQRNWSGLAHSHMPLQQQPSSHSLVSTPFLSQLPPPPSSSLGALGSGVPSGARRTRSNLLRASSFGSHSTIGAAAAAAAPAPAASAPPQVFCKYQRAEPQRRRHRLPPVPPGTRCPGMAGRLAFDAYRVAVRDGVVAEEEECSYYLSHRCVPPTSPCPTPAPAPAPPTMATPRTSLSPSPLRPRRAHAEHVSPLTAAAAAMMGQPLCVVSLADSARRARSSSPRTTAVSASSEKSRSDEGRSARPEGGSVASHATGGGGGAPAGDDEEAVDDSVTSPQCLYQIPRCCDDPYHRDEEALELLSITTTSSCAFGAGLEGLCWRDWMPSSPVDDGEVILRGAEKAAAATHAHESARGSKDGALGGGGGSQPSSCAVARTTPVCGGSFVTTSTSTTAAAGAAAAASVQAPMVQVPNNSLTATLSDHRRTPGAVALSAARLLDRSPLDLSAPRHSDDLVSVQRAGGDADVADPLMCSTVSRSGGGGEAQLRTYSFAAASTDSGVMNASGSSKRPFIAEWIVSKLQKHMEKKLKKQRKQQEREAAAAAAATGGAKRVSAEETPLQARFDVAPEALTSSSSGVAALRTGSRNSSLTEDFSDASSPVTGGSFARSPHNSHTRTQSQQQQPLPLPRSTTMVPSAVDERDARSEKAAAAAAEAERRHRERQQLAYLAAAYQTELVIHEQKRREVAANQRGLEALVHRSRAKMTPAAAAAGYYYESHLAEPPMLLHPQQQPFTPLPFQPVVDVASNGGNPGGSNAKGGTGSSSSSTRTGSITSYSSGYARPPAAQGQEPQRRRVGKPGDGAAAGARAPSAVVNVQSPGPQRPSTTTAGPSPSSPATGGTRRASQPQPQPQPQQQQRQSSRAHAQTSAAETERVRAALDTVKTKKKSIELWMLAVHR